MPRTVTAADAAAHIERREPPPVERVADGVWSVPVPLPAHEHRFTELDSRLDVLRRHHRRRLAQVAGALRVGAVHGWDIAAAVTWHRPFEELRGFALRSALQDTLACLSLLHARGLVRREPGPPERWYPRT